MKIFTQFFTACLFVQPMFAQSVNTNPVIPDSWTQKADFGGTARYGAVGFSIGNKGYLGTGSDNAGSYTKDFWEYNPDDDTWTQKADFGGNARRQATGFSIGNKGYLGTGSFGFNYYKDFWEYDPDANTWTQKADFGGDGREAPVGFSIGNKGYVGTGHAYIGGEIYYRDFWEYDPGTDSWTHKSDFGGTPRSYAAGFSIGSKGYLGTGFDIDYNVKEDFWEYDPAANKWLQKADAFVTNGAVGFSIGNKGYIGTGGFEPASFWEYDPVADNWLQKDDFGGTERQGAVGFSISDKGYIGTGSSYTFTKDFWEYIPGNVCPQPTGLKVLFVSDTCAKLTWDVTNANVSKLQLRYRALNNNVWDKQRKNPAKNVVYINGLLPNTTYRWQLRSFCKEDTSAWVSGPNFTTTATFHSLISSANTSGIGENNVRLLIIPNPGNGNFVLQMQLPAKEALTTLTLFNSVGERVWQQHAGMISGTVTKNIDLQNRLSAGIYMLWIERSDIRLIQRVVVDK